MYYVAKTGPFGSYVVFNGFPVDFQGKPWSPDDVIVRKWLYVTRALAEAAAVVFNARIKVMV